MAKDDSHDELSGDVVYFRSDMLGGEAFEKAQNVALLKKMTKRFLESVNEILRVETIKKPNNHIYTKNDTNKKEYNTYLGKKKYIKGENRSIIFAVLEDKSIGLFNKDLIFTISGIILDKPSLGRREPLIYQYSDIKYNDDDGTLVFSVDGKDEKYENGEIDLTALNNLIQSLAEIAYEANESAPDSDQYLTYSDSLMIEASNK